MNIIFLLRFEYPNINLELNHPVKELIWIIQDAIKNKHSTEGGQFYNNTNNYWNRNLYQNSKSNYPHYKTTLKNRKIDYLKSAVIQFNGNSLFPKDANYFRKCTTLSTSHRFL